MKSCCIQTRPSPTPSSMVGHAILEGKSPSLKSRTSSTTSKPSADLDLLKFLLLLRVNGEGRAEIEKLLFGAVGFKPNKEPKASDTTNQRLQEADHTAADTEQQQQQKSPSKRSSITRRWRKSSLKKKAAEEDQHVISRKSSCSANSTALPTESSSVKSTQSSPSPSQDVQIPGSNLSSNGCVSYNMETSDAAFSSDSAGESDMSMLQKLALNALNLTAPASSVLLKNRRNTWIQLSGHPGSLAPAGPGTIWKKRGPDPVETHAYMALAKDPAREITPTFFREIKYQDEYFIEMGDLLYSFNNPCVMDIKMGTRTFLETEVSNTTARHDLYQKMIKVDATAPTPEELEAKAVTKLRYMDFRDNMSSSRLLGFRIEALKMTGSDAVTELQTVRSREEVFDIMSGFLRGRDSTKRQIIQRLQHIRSVFAKSPFFQQHEVIGSSILIIYDDDKAGVWLIDFAKTVPLPEGFKVNHEDPWKLGNHEEGYLFGIDNLIKVVEDVPVTKTKKLGLFCTP